MYEFVELSYSSNGGPTALREDAVARHRIRRHVMLVHRRRERDEAPEDQDASGHHSPKRKGQRKTADQRQPSHGVNHGTLAQQHNEWARPTTSSLPSPGVLRGQHTEIFLWHWYPLGTSDNDFMYPRYLSRHILQPQGPAMQAAIDTLGFLQLGHISKDDRWLPRARNSYLAAISTVRTSLADRTGPLSDGLLGAIYLMGFCALSPRLTVFNGGQNIHTHIRALSAAIQGRRDHRSPFLERLASNCFHIIATFSIFSNTGSDPILSRIRVSDTSSSRTVSLSELMSRLAPLKKKIHSHQQRGFTSRYRAIDALVDLAALETAIHNYQLPYFLYEDGQTYFLCPVALLPEFVAAVGNCLGPFQDVFWFRSFDHALILTVCWVFMLHVRLMMGQLIDSNPEAQGLEAEYAGTLLQKATQCADDICRSLPWMYQSKHGTCGVLRNGTALYMARTWYTYEGDLLKRAWCERVLRSTERNALFAPNFTGLFPQIEGLE